jgi:carboxyl-terminal processing protease
MCCSIELGLFMFERYTEKARRTIFFWRYKGSQFGSPVGPGAWESAMKSLWCPCLLVLAITLLVTAFAPSGAAHKSGKYTNLTNDQVREMLNRIEEDIKERYYDPTFHGFDLDARFESARKKIAVAQSQNEALLDVAGAVASLNDPHTRFLPPPAPYGIEYGWRMQAIGDSDCYVTEVRSDSDAATKGLKPGDQVISENGVILTRQDLPYIEYGYSVFPQSGMRLVVHSADGAQKTVVAMAKILPGQKVIHFDDMMSWRRHYAHDIAKDRSRYYVKGDVLFWKLPDFFLPPVDVEQSVDKTHSVANVVLDLRGNPGGSVTTLKTLVGGFFAHDVRIGELKTRSGSHPQIAKTLVGKAFGGKLVVLIDSRSGSAAEVFARVVQLEKRGIVLGDRSAGAVTEAQFFPRVFSLSPTATVIYGAEITVAALVMTDGGTLENVGVMPDERILPNPTDIAELHDPVLARAAELAGVQMTVEEAGGIFPFEWPKEKMPKIE